MIKFGQIGCGYWGPNLLRATQNCKTSFLQSVCEISPTRKAYLSHQFPDVNLFSSPSDLWDDPSIDAIVIATPVFNHFSLAKEALLKGKHVFVEKPMATTVEEVDVLTELAQKKGLCLMSGHTFLYHNVVRSIKTTYLQELGELFYFCSKRLNLGKIRTDVNAWWNLAPHDISILLYLLEDLPESISVSGQAFLQKNIEDLSFATLQWKNGVTAHIHVSWLDPKKIREFTIVGSKKMIIFDDVSSDYKLKIYDKGIDKQVNSHDFDEPSFSFSYRNANLECPVIPLKEPLQEEISHFCHCITHQIEPISGPSHTRKVIQVLQAGDLSQKRKGEKILLESLEVVL